MIKRDRYLNQLINARNNGFPKVITGVIRCGKSFLLKEIYREGSEKVLQEIIETNSYNCRKENQAERFRY